MIDINVPNIITIGLIAVIFVWLVRVGLAKFKVGQMSPAGA